MKTRKTTKADGENKKGLFLLIGLTASLAMTLFFLELKSYESGPGDLGKMSYDDEDEIVLHKAGHAPNNHHIYLKTVRQAASGNGVLKLQIASTATTTGNSTYTFKFRRMI